MKPSRPLRATGVTLIEFLVGLAMMSLLMALAVPSFREWIANSQVRTAAESVNGAIRQARNEAVRSNTPARWTLTDANGGGWVIQRFDREAGNWVQVAVRGAGEGGGRVVVAASQATVVFLGNGLVNPLPANPIRIDFSHPNGACVSGDTGEVRCLRVLVAAGGEVRLCDPAVGTTSPLACPAT
ncbi:MAG: GspH/FimT family pseudopilin [Burkholderiales bacterium]|nr:GspH/FimT family pseudopilin [Burkholderiales bacterium]